MTTRGMAPAQLAPGDLLERVARALENAPAGLPVVVTFPAPSVDPLALLASGDDACLWTDREGRLTAARGSALRLEADGSGRFGRIAAAAGDLAARIRTVSLGGEDAPAARLVGGASFMPGAASGDDWRGFGDASFDLPRFALIEDGSRHAWLQVALPDARSPQERKQTIHELERILASVPALPPGRLRLRGEIDAASDRARWAGLVRDALDAIDAGRARKIVTARSVRFATSTAVDVGSIGGALLAVEGTYRFLVRRGDVVFAGATPERLIQRTDARLRTEALAGTARADDASGRPLALRDKDLREHGEVVAAIDEALRPLCTSLERPDTPIVRRHGGIEHLATPYVGSLAAPRHILEILERLHPTPAVGGTPRDMALEFLEAHEPPRGWYAGAVGWIDLAGDGELAVALRCVRTDGTALDAFAGAGIVEGSDADTEFDETALKMRATLGAIGAIIDA